VVQDTEQIQGINAKLNGGFKIAVVPVEQLEFLQKNARFMKNDMFQILVENIKKDGGLSQLPFCYLQENGKYKILSGNHRSEAAIKAGLTEIPVLYTDKPLTKDEQIAIQLSHNAISGEDDPIILKELYEEIEDLSLKYYTGLDDRALEQLENVEIKGITEAQLEYQSVQFLFLPDEYDRMVEVFDKAISDLPPNHTVLARWQEYDQFLEAKNKVQGAYNIHNAATVIMIMLDIFEKHQEELQKGWVGEDGEPLYVSYKRSLIPLSSLFGQDYIPIKSLGVIKKALEKMLSKGEIESVEKWRAIEYWATNYLNGD
jgi:hypothetical protein